MKKFIAIVALSIILIASPAKADFSDYTREIYGELKRFLPQLLTEQRKQTKEMRKQTYIACIALHRVDMQSDNFAEYSNTVSICEQHNPGIGEIAIQPGQIRR